MQRSSESIAALAAALAKAQIELVNPEKSLSATIYLERGGKERTFRYAALANGLDIVRKTLGRHELAVIQTTQPSPESGTLQLNTILAHASGEWIASDWPVCSMADVGSPRRMGAALTYARRYSLFTLVGIAGEDDLDAPDLIHSDNPVPKTNGVGGANPARQNIHAAPLRTFLDPERSAALRDQLMQEIAALTSETQASEWAVQALRSKNSLLTADAQTIETGFAGRLALLAQANLLAGTAVSSQPPGDGGSAESNGQTAAATISTLDDQDFRRGRSTGDRNWTRQVSSADRKIDKSILTFAEPRRYRDKGHLRYVATQACLICNRKPCDAHHLGFAQPRALGRKVSDEFTVPLCRGHHGELHRAGDERQWWVRIGIDPLRIAGELWSKTRVPTRQKSSKPARKPVGPKAGSRANS